MSDSDKIKELEERIKSLETQMGSSKKSKSDKPKKPRKPSKYNEFMKKEIAKIKKAEKDITHKEAWKQATAAWGKSKESS